MKIMVMNVLEVEVEIETKGDEKNQDLESNSQGKYKSRSHEVL